MESFLTCPESFRSRTRVQDGRISEQVYRSFGSAPYLFPLAFVFLDSHPRPHRHFPRDDAHRVWLSRRFKIRAPVGIIDSLLRTDDRSVRGNRDASGWGRVAYVKAALDWCRRVHGLCGPAVAGHIGDVHRDIRRPVELQLVDVVGVDLVLAEIRLLGPHQRT